MGSSSKCTAMGRYGGKTWSERRGSTRAGSEFVGMGVGVSFLPSFLPLGHLSVHTVLGAHADDSQHQGQGMQMSSNQSPNASPSSHGTGTFGQTERYLLCPYGHVAPSQSVKLWEQVSLALAATVLRCSTRPACDRGAIARRTLKFFLGPSVN